MRKPTKSNKSIQEKTPPAEDLLDIGKSGANIKRHSCEITTLSASNAGNELSKTPEILRRGRTQSKMTKGFTFVVDSPFPDNQEKRDTNTVFKFPELNASVNGLCTKHVNASAINTDKIDSDIKGDAVAHQEQLNKNLSLHHDHEGK